MFEIVKNPKINLIFSAASKIKKTGIKLKPISNLNDKNQNPTETTSGTKT